MLSIKPILGAAGLGIACLVLDLSAAQAGRLNGPVSTLVAIPTRQSVYFDVPFVAGEPATISIAGNGKSELELFIYDNDGHIAVGSGTGDRKSATITVYRVGMLRIHVRNLGARDNTFVLTIN